MNRYPIKPNKITAVTISFATKKVEFEESSYVQKIATRKQPKRTFRFEHFALDKANEAILTQFFTDCKGSLTKFSFYNHVDGVEYECFFKSDTLTINRTNAYFANISIEVETC